MVLGLGTLGYAARNGTRISVRCRDCEGGASFLATDIARFTDARRRLDGLRFRCRDCKGGRVEVTAADLERGGLPSSVVEQPIFRKAN